MSTWFKRKDKGIQTPTEKKKIFLRVYGIKHLAVKL